MAKKPPNCTGAKPGFGKQGKMPQHPLPKQGGGKGASAHGKQGAPHSGHEGGIGGTHGGGY